MLLHFLIPSNTDSISYLLTKSLDLAEYLTKIVSDNDIRLDDNLSLRVHATRLLYGPRAITDAEVPLVDRGAKASRTVWDDVLRAEEEEAPGVVPACVASRQHADHDMGRSQVCWRFVRVFETYSWIVRNLNSKLINLLLVFDRAIEKFHDLIGQCWVRSQNKAGHFWEVIEAMIFKATLES